MKLQPLTLPELESKYTQVICSPKELEIIKIALDHLSGNVTMKPTINIKADELRNQILDYQSKTNKERDDYSN